MEWDKYFKKVVTNAIWHTDKYIIGQFYALEDPS